MRRQLSWLVLLCSAAVFSQAVQAQSWQATAGAQSRDMAVQALAFLPNEIWIHAGDSGWLSLRRLRVRKQWSHHYCGNDLHGDFSGGG